MIEQILYQMLGVTMIVFVLVFLWWAHLFGKETKRMMDEVLEKRSVIGSEPTLTVSEFNPGGYVMAKEPEKTSPSSLVVHDGVTERGRMGGFKVPSSFVLYDGMMVPVLPEVMQELGLREYQMVCQETAMQIMNLNALIAIERCETALRENKE